MMFGLKANSLLKYFIMSTSSFTITIRFIAFIAQILHYNINTYTIQRNALQNAAKSVLLDDTVLALI